MKNTKNYLLISAWVIITMLLAYFIYSIISTNSLIDHIESQITQQHTKKSDLSEQKYTFQEKLEIFDRDQICKSRAEYRRDRIDQEWKSRFLTIFYSPILNSCVIAQQKVSPDIRSCVYETDDPDCYEKTNMLDVMYTLSTEGFGEFRYVGVVFAKDVKSWWVVVYYEENDNLSKMQKPDTWDIVMSFNPVGWDDVFVWQIRQIRLSSYIKYRQEEDYYKNKINEIKWIIPILNNMFLSEIDFLRGAQYERKLKTEQFFSGNFVIYE